MRLLLEDAECAGASLVGLVRVRFRLGSESVELGQVDSRTRGRPSMLPCSCVAESGYVRAEPGEA